MGELIELAINVGIFLCLFAVGLFAGRAAEKKHLRSLEEREKACAGFSVTDLRATPGCDPGVTPELVCGEATIASDYFKTFVSGLKNILGGNVPEFERLQMRARREAVLRMVETARGRGFDAVANLRITTADIGGNATGGKGLPMATVLVSGTAYARRK